MKHDTVIPYVKKIQKHINHLKHALNSADIRIFSPEVNPFYYIK